jgi:hypothetical protein
MNRIPRLADFLAREQVERVGLDRCRFLKRTDGTTAVIVDDDDGVSLIGPSYDVDADDVWPFEASTEVVVLTWVGGDYHARDIREVLNSPRLTTEGIGELMRDPNFRLVVELTQAKSVAIEGVDRLVDDIGAALVMFAEGDTAAAADTIGAAHANASSLLAELRDPGLR